MVLILGALGAGKLAYAHSLGYADAQIAQAVLDDRPALAGLETLVRSDPADADALFGALCKKELVLCCEVGCGVIPLDRADRAYREAVGRLCTRLAAEATAVVRVIAGIPVAIKGELPCARS